MEDYRAELQYIEGEKNVVADALSRLPTEEIFTFTEEDTEFPLNLATLARKQQSDTYLQAALQRDPSDYVATQQEGNKIYVLKSTKTIYVPLSLRAAILQWYHTSLQHPGIKRMQYTVKESFYWPGIDAAIDTLVRACATCQQCKITAVK